MKATVSGVFEDLKFKISEGPQVLQKLWPSQYLDTKLGETPKISAINSPCEGL